MIYQIVVAHKDQSEFPQGFAAGHEWSVEGDYGFFGSFRTQKEAWVFAENEISGAKLNAEVVLNA